PGTRGGDLELTWRPPGWKIGAALAAAGSVGLAILEIEYRRGRRRRAEPPVPPPTEPVAGEPDLVVVRL
ncbi:MAG: hypothetical protein HOQ36_15685, partial [Nocardia sp.]|nr:hypothetical protein [Nocardia sp.]